VSPRVFTLALAIAATFTTAPAQAGAERPVYVVVVGRGAIRFRLAVGSNAPCDSRDNQMLFDSWLASGQYLWVTTASLVCYQNTSGALRNSNWSEPRFVPTLITVSRALPPRTTVITVSTD
jgi:hypothetical protein